MFVTNAQLAGVVLAASAVTGFSGYVIGKTKAVKQVQEKIVYREIAVRDEKKTTSVAAVAQNNTRVVTKWRTRVVTPEGKCEETEGERSESGESATVTKSTRESSTKSSDNVAASSDKKESTPLAMTHRFVLGARGSVNISTGIITELYGGLRLIGPIEAGISFDPIVRKPALWARAEWRF